MMVVEMMLSRGVVDIGEDAGWVTREFTGDTGIVTVATGTPSTDPITWDDVCAMHRKLTPEAYR
jgi:hypothetical protein